LPLSVLIGLGFWTNRTESQTNYIFEWLTADRQLIRRKALLILSGSKDQHVRRGVAGYFGAGRMAWEATAGNWRRWQAAALGFGGLLLVRRKASML